jgi:hypothetical protein
MAGTPIIVNVTGGMQDQCGFKKEDGSYIMAEDYSDEFPTNAEGRYKDHGEWAKVVFPAARTLQGSVPTPYIFDDIACYKETSNKIYEWYNTSKEERKQSGLKGREHFLKPEIGLSAESMGNNFIKDINTALKNWKPRQKFELTKI